MSPVSKGRKPHGRKSSGHRGGVRRDSGTPPTLATALARDGHRLSAGSALGASLAASAWFGAAWQQRETPFSDTGTGIVDEGIEATRKPGGWAALFAIASVADPEWAVRVNAVLERCPALSRPAWGHESTRAPLPTDAALAAMDDGSQLVYVLNYDEPEPHALFVTVSTPGGLLVLSIEATEPVTGGLTAPEGVTVGPIAVDEALSQVRRAMDVTDSYWPAEDTSDYLDLRQLLRHRTDGYEDDIEPDNGPISDEQWDQLTDAFVVAARAQGTELDDTSLAIFVGDLLDHGSEHVAHGLDWTPDDARGYLLDVLPEDALIDETQAAEAPNLMRTWFGVLSEQLGWSSDRVQELAAAVDEAEPEYLDWFSTAFSEDADPLAQLFSTQPATDG